MTERTYTVEVQGDFLEQQAQARPLLAVAELIWNAFDADATRVEVRLEYNELGQMSRILVRDNGHGIPHSQAPTLFTRLGGSWKKPGMRTKGKGRALHGHEGRGRFKVFALGRVADWHVCYRDADQELFVYEMVILEDSIDKFRVSDQSRVEHGEAGVEVTISELHSTFRSLERESALPELAETFALYLKDYRDVRISVEGTEIDPEAAIVSVHRGALSDISNELGSHPAELEIIEWRTQTTRALYLCTEDGFPLSRVTERRFHVGEFQFSAYLKSAFITELNKSGQLELAEMHPALNAAVDEAQEKIREYFRDRAAARAKSVVEEWIEEKIYPYEGAPQTIVEDAERKIFNIVAVTASDYMPDFRRSPTKNRAYQLRMLRTAIEKSPKELQIIMNEILGLPKRKQEELAALLEEASLSNIITAAREVADRLKFVAGLEMILFDEDMKTHLKERSQLHQILADNTWVFGEEYNLSVSDRSLTEVLRRHKELLAEDIVIDTPVKHYSKERGIVDLMLSRALRRHRADELEHLVIELKAPKVVLGKKEVNQIEEYAFAVVDDDRFKKNNVRWTFWVISDSMDSFAENRIHENEYQLGTIHRKGNVVIAIKKWSHVLEDNKARLQFFQEKLQHQAGDDESLKFLRDKYERFLKGVITDDAIDKHAANEPLNPAVGE